MNDAETIAAQAAELAQLRETVATVTRERDEAKRSSRMYELLRREAFAYRNAAIAERDEARAKLNESGKMMIRLAEQSAVSDRINTETQQELTSERDSLASQLDQANAEVASLKNIIGELP